MAVSKHAAFIATINPIPMTVTGVVLSEGGSPQELVDILPLFYGRGATRRLVRLGAIKRLGHRVAPFSDRHNFDEPETGTTLAYQRDGGFPRAKPHLPVTRAHIIDAARYADSRNCQFIYLIDRRGRWHWQRVGPKVHNWLMRPLTRENVAQFYGLQA
jgi:hypothetical protein